MTKQFFIKINLGNELMQDGADVAEALREVADKIDGLALKFPFSEAYSIQDKNGNTVGSYGVKEIRTPKVRV
jgi:hypothetical protein